jgi:hypothetical protein
MIEGSGSKSVPDLRILEAQKHTDPDPQHWLYGSPVIENFHSGKRYSRFPGVISLPVSPPPHSLRINSKSSASNSINLLSWRVLETSWIYSTPYVRIGKFKKIKMKRRKKCETCYTLSF